MANLNPYAEIQSALDLMGTGYRVQSDPTNNGRVIITSPKGQTLNINLQAADEMGPVGKTWTLPTDSGSQAKVINPELTGTYLEDSGEVGWSGKTSSQQTAHVFHEAARIAKRKNSDWKSEVHNLLARGDKELGISPAPSIDYRSSPAIQRQTTNQIAVNVRSSSETGVAFPDQARTVISSLQRNIALGSQTKVAPAEISIPRDKQGQPLEPGGMPFSFRALSENQMMPGDTGELKPNAIAQPALGFQVEGKWPMLKTPEKRSKAPKLGVGVSDEVRPYMLLDRKLGQVQPLTPEVTTNTNKPQYAYANVLGTGETEARAKQRGWFVYGKSPVAGTAFTYEVPGEEKISFMGDKASKNVPIEGVSVYDLMEGRAKIDIDKKLLGSELGGGVPVSRLGTLTREGQEPETIKARMGPSTFWANSVTGYIPSYINKETGKGVDITADDIYEDKEGNTHLKENSKIISTESLLPKLMEQTGLEWKRRPGEGTGIRLGGDMVAGVSLKENDTKAGLTFTGQQQALKVGGQNVDVKFFTGEAKGPGILSGLYEGMSYKQMQGILKDFSKVGGQGSAELLTAFQDRYAKRGKEGARLDVNMDELAGIYNEAGGGGDPIASGQALQARIFEKVIRSAYNPETGEFNDKLNQRNIKRYGAGLAKGGEQISLGVWHPETYAAQRENFARAMRDQSKGKEVTQEQIDTEWNKNFTAKETGRGGGYLNVSQTLQRGDVVMNKLYSMRRENVHGAGAGWEWLSGLSGQFPDFARQIGAHVESFQPKGKTQESALGLLKYGVWQGQRRESYQTGETMQMPTDAEGKPAYFEIGGDKMMQIAADIDRMKGNSNSLQMLEHIRDAYFKDAPKDQLGWNPETRQFVPNPHAILGGTFKELGVEAASLSRPAIGLFSALGEIASPFNDMTPEDRIEAGMEASQGMYKYASQLISGGGDFFKNLFSQMIPSGFGGRSAFDPTLGPNEMYMSQDMWKTVGRRMGFRGKSLTDFVSTARSSGVEGVESRYPMLTQDAINAIRMQTDEQRKMALGEEAYQNIERNPLNRGNIGVSLTWGQINAGDWDRDPIFGALGFRRNKETGALEKIDDAQVHSRQVTREMANFVESNFFQRQGFRDVVSSGVQQMVDYVKGKDVMGGILGGIGNYSAFDAVGAGINTWMSKTLGMGVGYNPRRAVFGGMAAGGYSNKEIQNVLETVPSFYQPALDKLLKGQAAAGVPAAALIAKSYVGTGEVANPRTGKKENRAYLHLGSVGDGTERSNRVSPSGTVLPEIKSPGFTMDVQAMMTDPSEIMAGSMFAIEQFARGAPLTKGGDAGLTAEQTAGWFAAPGESEKLAEMLGSDRKTWTANLGAYYTGLMQDAGGKRAGIESVLSVPFWRAIMARTGSKAINNTDVMTGETTGGAPGAEAAYEEIMGYLSPKYQTEASAGVAVHDIMHKGRPGLRGMIANRMRKAINAVPETSVLGAGLRSMGKMLNIPLQGPSYEEEQEQAFEAAFGVSPTTTPGNVAYSQKEVMRQSLPEGLKQRPASQQYSVRRLQKAMKDDDYLVFDTETTGKGADDEIIQVALRNAQGETVYNRRVRPTKQTVMDPEAQKAHGITMESLANEADWSEVGPEVQKLIQGRNVLGYNVKFDRDMLQQTEEISAAEMGHEVTDFKNAANYVDVLQPAKTLGYGKNSARLGSVAEEMGIETEGAHDANQDIRMTHDIAKKLQTQAVQEEQGYEEAIKRAGPLSGDEMRQLNALRQSQGDSGDNWAFNVLQERHNRYGAAEGTAKAPSATAKPKPIFNDADILRKAEKKQEMSPAEFGRYQELRRIQNARSNEQWMGEQDVAVAKRRAEKQQAAGESPDPAMAEFGADWFNQQGEVSLGGTPSAQSRGGRRYANPNFRMRRRPETVQPATANAETQRVQDQVSNEGEAERVRWFRGETNEVMMSQTREEVERKARWEREMQGTAGQGATAATAGTSQPTGSTPVDDPTRPVGGTRPDVVADARLKKYSQRVGHMVRGYALHVASAMQRTPAMPQLHTLLTEKFNMPGEETTEDISKRLYQVYTEKPDEFLAALPPELRDRLESLKGLQQERDQALAFKAEAPGLGQDYGWITEVLEAAQQTSVPGLGQDLTLASFSAMIGPKAPKGGKLRTAKGFAQAPEVRSFMGLLRGSGVLDSDKFGSEEINKVKGILAEGGRSLQEIAQEQGVTDLSQATPEQLEQFKTIRAREMSYQTVLKRAGKLDEHAANRAGVGELRQLSKEFTSMEGTASLSDKKGFIKADAEAIDRLGKAFENLTATSKKAAEAVDHVDDKEQKRLNTLKAQAELDLRSEALGVVKKANMGRIAQLTQEMKGSETWDMDKAKELSTLITAQPRIDKQMAATAQEKAELGDEKWGAAARRMLGGFGLMYMKSIFGFATGGLGYGEEQRRAHEQGSSQNIYRATGETFIPYNQQQVIQNRMALSGSNQNALAGANILWSQAPAARDLYNMGAAGLGAWGYTQFAASQIGGDVGKSLAGKAGLIGMLAAGATTALDVGAKANDPYSLGERYGWSREEGGGLPSINDNLAMLWLRATNQEGFGKAQESQQLANLMKNSTEQGLTFKQMKELKMVTGGDWFSSDELREQGYNVQTGDRTRQVSVSGGEANVTAPVDYVKAGDYFNDAKLLRGQQTRLTNLMPNLSPEAINEATVFSYRNQGATDDQLRTIAEDRQMGGFASSAAMQTAQAFGFNASQLMREDQNGYTQLGRLQLQLAEPMSEDQKTQYQTGLQFASQLPGAKRIEGFVDEAGNVDWQKATNFVMEVGKLAETPAGKVLQAQYQAYDINQRAGITTAKPQYTDFLKVTGEDERGRNTYGGAISISPLEQEEMMRETEASTAAAQNRLNLQSRWQNRVAVMGGAPDLGSSIADTFNQPRPGREFMLNNLMSMDPMTMSALAATNPSVFGQLNGPRNIQGMNLDPNFMATADRDLSGANVTGLGQFRTSLWMGNYNPEQMGQKIFGNISGAGTQAAIGGVKLPAPVTLPSGRTVEEVGGTMGIQWASQQEDWEYQQYQIDKQRKQAERDTAYQMQMWGLQDRQRALGHQHQLKSFDFQAQGMALQERGMEMNNRFFQQNTGLQQQQTQMQRSWTVQDWGINAMTRNMQWGWQQEDFQEERRFMTGRQRKLAERQQERAGVMHNLEDEQIDRSKKRQMEMWKLEDERFELQKQQHAESYQLQKEQFQLQQEQFAENKKFYIENKKIEDEIIALQRDHWLKQKDAEMEALDRAEEHAKKTLEYQQAQQLLNTYMELTNGEMKTLVDDSLIPLLESISNLSPESMQSLIEFINGAGAAAPSGSPSTANIPGFVPGSYVPPQIAAMFPPAGANSGAGLNPGGGGRAIGGTVDRGVPIPVGEGGPEMFVPQEHGMIMSNQELRAMLEGTGSSFRSGMFGEQTIGPSPLGGGSSRPTVVNVYIGNERLESYIVDAVGGQF